MRIYRYMVALAIGSFFSAALPAQPRHTKNYPQGYFRNPLDIPISLSGNFGELRPNHFHMGLDLRTNKRENLPVYAAADGYIARIKIEPYGFGRCIYINHPNGYTTVYAHLNNFFPELETYLKQIQYQQESWEQNLELPATLFPVQKGRFIAYSGNTGGSQAPHLHFEIRETQSEKVLNPMLFGFAIADNVPPDLLRLAVYDRCKSTYEQVPKIYPLKKVNGVYTVSPGILRFNTEKISFAIGATDRQTGSSNPNGIYEATLYQNEQPVIQFQLDSIGYNETRYLNAHIDYKTHAARGPYLQHLSQLPGDAGPVYKSLGGDGVIQLDDGGVHEIKMLVKDSYGNTSVLQLRVQMDSLYNPAPENRPVNTVKKCFPRYVNIVETPSLEFYLDDHALYDSVNLVYYEIFPNALPQGQVSNTHIIHNTTVPLHTYFRLRIKNPVALTPAQRQHVLVRRQSGTKTDVVRGEWQGEWVSAKFRDFGTFHLWLDTVPPVISTDFKENALLDKKTRLLIYAKDDQREIRRFRAELDGKWLRCTNDKAGAFIYVFDEKCGAGTHELKITAEDEAGNITEKTFHFIR
jgi:Peptidase family M23